MATATNSDLDLGHVLDKYALLESRIAELEKKLAQAEKHEPSTPPPEEPPTPTAATAAEPEPPATSNDSDTKAEESPSEDDERYTVIFREWDDASKEYKETKAPARTKKKAEVEVKKGRVLTYRKILDEANSDKVKDWEIDIEDRLLLDALKAEYQKLCPGNDRWWAEDTQTLYFPFRTVIWCYDQLEARAKAEEGDNEPLAQHKADIRQLLQFVRETPTLTGYFKTKESTPDQISFKFIWTLFPFGTEFVCSKKFLNIPQLFKLAYEGEAYDFQAEDPPNKWSLEGWCYDHTGSEWVRAVHEFEIQTYDRERPITSLDFYPVKYHVDGGQCATDSLWAARIEEGKKFVEFCTLDGPKRMRSYNDTVVSMSGSSTGGIFSADDASSRGHKRTIVKRPRVKSDMIVDSQAWFQQSLELPLGDSVPTLYFENDPFWDSSAPEKPVDDWVRFCPPRFFGFMIKEKASVQLKLGGLGAITPHDRGPFETELQLTQDSKDLLRALVENHANKNNEQQMDVVAGKGNSLVILLHGGPGLGKTLTAETLAKATGKPLLTANVADIGVAAESAESKLERHFERAARWDAILLIDEADAFLEERKDTTSPDQNALVTVMLRILEYYNGIIILTTNRLLSLDPAVQSRIHLALYFDNLPPKNLVNIFMNLLDRFDVDPISQEHLRLWFEVMSSNSKMNGREIRNLVHSAIALARSKERPVNRQDFITVVDKLRGFHEHLSDKFTMWKARNQGYQGR